MSVRRSLVAVCGLTACALLASSAAFGQKPSLKEVLKDDNATGVEDVWVYNDIASARKEAERTGKPLFVTFRCVPCKACAGFDAEVAQGNVKLLKLAQTKFVPVRQVEMKDVDLDWFQFDHDLNWAAMFVNPDGTVYARYGTQSAEGPDAYNSVEGLETTMRKVLELHAAYPDNKAELAGKRGPKRSYSTALEMPGLKNKAKYRGATARNNCIHCHNIHDAQHEHAKATGKFRYEMLYRFPYPENVGLSLDRTDGRTITAVRKGSPADKAGLVKGEELTHVDGQVVASIADVQWALHRLDYDAKSVEVRGSKSGERTLALGPDWKKYDISWRGSMWSVSPVMRVWMPELPDNKRRNLRIPEGQNALEVRWINRGAAGGKAAFESGLRQGDVVVAVAGKPITESNHRRFHMWMKLNYEVGQKLPVTVLRKGKKLDLQIKLVE